MLNTIRIVEEYLANKIAIEELHDLAQRLNVRIHPILGLGSAPFRGGLNPYAVDRTVGEYPSVVTYTIQSAFKYDHPVDTDRRAIKFLKKHRGGQTQRIDRKRILHLIGRSTRVYRKRVVDLAPTVNTYACFLPERRARKLHIGLFGYARNLDGVTLTRAISFTWSLYSAGLPPELIAFETLMKEDLEFLRFTILCSIVRSPTHYATTIPIAR